MQEAAQPKHTTEPCFVRHILSGEHSLDEHKTITNSSKKNHFSRSTITIELATSESYITTNTTKTLFLHSHFVTVLLSLQLPLF